MPQGARATRRVAELDGMRGIAILLVLACHAIGAAGGLLGGAGVTVFFVLSGYLITGILLRERENTGRIDLVAFYRRRARRLLPALTALVLAVILASAFLHGDDWLPWRSLAPVGLYYANWWAITDGHLGALVHTWSLAVEEQFYIVWPLAVIALATRRRVAWFAILLIGVSLLLRLSLVGPGQVPRVYFGTDTAGLALLVGVLLACSRRRPRGRAWVPAVALAAIVALTLMSPAPFVWVGMPLVAVASAAAIWWSRDVVWLRAPWLRWFGDRSYGLYLVNLPVFIALRDYGRLPALLVAVLGLTLSLVLAELSFRYVEARWLRPRPTVERRPTPVGLRDGSIAVTSDLVLELKLRSEATDRAAADAPGPTVPRTAAA